MNRRSAIKSIAAISATIGAPVVVRAQGRQFEGVEISVNNYGGDYSRLIQEHVAKPLEARTGLHVSYQHGTVASAVAKLMASKDSPPFDIIMADSPNIPELIRANVADSITVDDVPNINKVLPGAREFGDIGVPFLTNAIILAYNSDLVKQPVSSYLDFDRSDLKNRVGWLSPENTGGVLSLIALAQANGGSLNNLQPAFDLLARLSDNIETITPSTTTLQQLFEQQEIGFAPFWDGRTFAMRAKGLPIHTVIPKEGIYALYNYLIPIKGSKKIEAIRAYMQQALSDEAIRPMVEYFRYAPCTDVILDEKTASEVVVYGANRNLVKPVDWVKVSQLRGEIMDRFNKAIR